MKRLESIAALLLLITHVPPEASASPIEGDIEIDPIAYALSGYSVHAGVARGRWRLDLGGFALAVPSFIHGADGFDVSFHGFGLKLQAFKNKTRHGWFVGVETALARMLAKRRNTSLASEDFQVSAGVQVGYRFSLPSGFYATPWIGVGRVFGSDEVSLDGETYSPSRFNVFPTVHLGYEF